MDSLLRKSIAIILENQSANGAYIASPNFSPYRYCWFRDGSFIAYSMDLAGEFESARNFHTWAARQVINRKNVVGQAVALSQSNSLLTEHDHLHTRYKLDGSDGAEEAWPNFQLDGFGTWLWSLNEHQRLSGSPISEEIQDAARLVTDYLEALWMLPCFDCWEEFPEQVHPYTLAAIYGGVQAQAQLGAGDHQGILDAIRSRLLEKWVYNGHFVKFSGRGLVDASLLGLATPYNVFEPQSELVRKTVDEIEATLLCEGGVHRYSEDSYYGGGEWLLLSAWLGWYHAEIGDDIAISKAHKLLQWVESHFVEEGLPEQVPDHLNAPDFYQVWADRWGKIALPLLWSHANHIILRKKLETLLK
jgi:GH15 family glucan-1,4-alpha-glucosidase